MDEAEETKAVPAVVKAGDTIEQKAATVLTSATARARAFVDAETARREAKPVEIKRVVRSHRQLPEVIDMLNTTGIAFLTGPSGTGKSTLAKQACAELFELNGADPITSGKYAQISFSPDTTSGEMIGRTDVHGDFHESQIVKVFREGGVILFDEIDDADPSMLIKVNTALANGYLATPVGMVQKSPSTYIVCAANTFGTGPDAMYVGRTRLDAATLDRFCLSTIYVDYDEKLEEGIASVLPERDMYWLMGYTAQVRSAIREHKMRRVCSTRFVINATEHLKKGKDTKWIRENFLQGWSKAEKAKVEAAADSSNPWVRKQLNAEKARKAEGSYSYKQPSKFGFF